MNTIVRAVIDKGRGRGWSCTTYVQYPDWPNESVTNSSYGTLKRALWHVVLSCMDLDAVLLSVVVKGRLMSNTGIWHHVHQALVGGVLAYKLPAIKEYLEITK